MIVIITKIFDINRNREISYNYCEKLLAKYLSIRGKFTFQNRRYVSYSTFLLSVFEVGVRPSYY